MAGSVVTEFRWKKSPQPQPQNETIISESDSDSGSDSENHQHRHNDLSNSIFKAYLDCHSSSSPSSVDLAKIQSFLASSSSGAVSCLICLERIKRTDPTWSCTSLCFAVFHLFCIQSWARQCLDLQAARAVTRPSSNSIEPEAVWNCPKCRSSYKKSEIPRRYLCYCGKEEDPPADNPWILPHSCGEVCERPLSNNCGHCCLLLCHPGPCASCPKLVKAKCFCEGVEYVRRCGHKQFSCGDVCERLLDCDIHKCREICHDGKCPPCRERAVYKCCCGKVKEEKDCCERVFRCEAPCENMLNCGKHVCERGCHSGECGLCPYQGKRSCPCGKRFYLGLSCDVEAPLCGGTCDKVLGCGYHRCPERCHRGPCLETCRIVVTKSCRCIGTKKQVPCHQELVCERKCQRVRDCARHACRRRCCDGECPPCSEICGKKLRCRNHKCQSPCHQDPFTPCPVMVTISCACGETHFEVPCGTETNQKPPRCRKLCRITPLCRHGQNQKPHKCHYGTCPPCRLLCINYNTLSEKDQSKARSCRGPCHRKLPNCTHLCPEICHPGQCPLPEKCEKKVVVRCKCLTLKKEWICQDVQAAHRATGSDPKEVPKNQFGVSILPCDSNCKSKLQVAESVLQQRNVKETEEKDEPTGKNATKRRKRRERGQDIKETTRLQKLAATTKKGLMVVMLMAMLVAVSYYGYKGLLWLSDWMNELEEQRHKSRRHPRF